MTSVAIDTDRTPEHEFPTRYRAAEERGARLGRPLRLAARIREIDEDLLVRLGRGFMETDDLGGRLAKAMRLPATDPNRVTMADFRLALAEGIDAVPDAPAALREFFDVVETIPEWVDWDLIEEGARVFRFLGQNSLDILLQLSLIGGYRFGGPTDLLVATGGLSGDSTMRRLGETQKWGVALSQPGGLRRGSEGYSVAVHVRLMHALVNESFTSRWDVERWGMPINQTDQAATLGLFNGVPLIGCRALGARITRADSRAYMHLWKYIGWLMGVDEQWLVETEREQHRLNYHVLLVQDDISDAGPQLANAIVDAQDSLHFRRFPAISRWLARERLLSMLTMLLGPSSMRDLELPIRPPWAPTYVFALNFLRYRVIGMTPWGHEALIRWGDRVAARTLYRHFGADRAEVGDLPV
ncbi:MAG TPA: oxygenase MpaB family protein [Aeromicrobium sp.]|nr:oxygenase MpaB family protein [Aeromicrobium sp.]HKY56417.1 oxygenase MpaB family protein [Aeromicrobium sp.]